MPRVINPYYEIETDIQGEKILEQLEKAGRTCYKSEDAIKPGSAREFVRKILVRGHESVIEHISVSVRLIVDRGVTHELVRHRLVAYSQESTRYCNYKSEGEITVIRPFFFSADGHDKRKYEIWHKAMEETEKAYNQLIELGALPQEARSVLPNSLKTEIVVSANLREWRHIFTMRTSAKAHPQMREIMIPLLKRFKKMIPVLFDDFEIDVDQCCAVKDSDYWSK